MDTEKPLAFSPARKVYRPSPRRYLKREVLTSGVFPVVSFGLLFLLILLNPIFTGHPEYLFGSLIGLVFLGPLEVFFVFYLLWRTHLRLVTSVEGIEYSTVGYRIFTPWDNVAGVGTRQEFFTSARGPGWTREIGGLELHQPAPVYKARPLVRLLLRLHGIERPSFFIPVSQVIENWQGSEVAADIQRYAPQTAMKMPLLRGSSSPDVKELLQRDDIEGLIAALTDPADEIRETAARALGNSVDTRAVDPLITALQDTAYRVRKAAANALGYIGDARAVDPLLHVVLEDRDLAMLEVAASALGQIGDVRAVEVLITIARDPGYHESEVIQSKVALTLQTLQKNQGYREEIRKAAASALKQITSSRRKSQTSMRSQ